MNEDHVPSNSGGAALEVPREIRVVPDDLNTLSLPMVEQQWGSARALVWPGMGAHLRSMHRISLRAGARTIPLRHPMEAVYYVMTGRVEVHDMDDDVRHQVATGGMVLIDPGTEYRMSAGSEPSDIVGGPCPPDPAMYTSLKVE